MKRDATARALLAAYRERDDFRAERQEVVWAGLERRLAREQGPRFDDAPVPAPDERPRQGRPQWLIAGVVIAAAVVLVVATLWSGATAPNALDAPPRSQATFESPGPTVNEARSETRPDRRPHPVADATPRETPMPFRSEAAAAPRPQAAPTVEPRRERARPRVAKSATATPSAMARELALLQQAHLALGRGAPAAALAALQTHAREFPRGSLAPERWGLRAIALCQLDRPEGRTRAKAFVAAHPDSALRARVRSACTKKSAPTQMPVRADK